MTFNTKYGNKFKAKGARVLNLVINGWPSILFRLDSLNKAGLGF